MCVVVVGAAIVRCGRLLVAQRATPPALAGGWELPGGKVDPGERDEDALVRECREELGVDVRLTGRFDEEWPIPPSAVLRVWTARLVRGWPRPLEHAALRWLAPAELYDVPWLSADLPLIPHLQAALNGQPGDGETRSRPSGQRSHL